jgi:hypothetical protein
MAGLLRGKKKIISLMAGSAGGRGAMMKLIGRDGQMCMDAISTATKAVSGAKFAKEQSSIIFKVASKAALMIKENLITPRELSATLKIVAELVNDVIEISSTKLDFLDVEVATSTVIRHLQKVEVALTEAMTPHTHERTVVKLASLFAYFRSPPFLVQFISDPALAQTRLDLRQSLKALVPQGGITGAPRYNKRDNEGIKDTIACPRLEQFVTEPKRMTYFRSFLEAAGASAQPLAFCAAVGAFKQIRNKAVLTSRAELICEKYMVVGREFYIEFDPALVERARALLTEEGKLNRAMFAPMVEASLALLGTHFDGFCASPQFAEFVTSTEIEFDIEAWRAERGGGDGAAASK